MTVKEARKIISDACFSVKRDGDDYLFWGYSPQGVPSSYLHIRTRAEKSDLVQVANACQQVRERMAAGERFPSAYAQRQAIRKALRSQEVSQ